MSRSHRDAAPPRHARSRAAAHRHWRPRRVPSVLSLAAVVLLTAVVAYHALRSPDRPVFHPADPPPPGGYFRLQPVGAWTTLPSGTSCTNAVHRSSWEPRPDNYKPNHTMPDPAAVHAALAARPVSTMGAYDKRWDSWLRPRVDGQFTGTTDEIFQWAACKWGLPDNVLRAMAVRESTWYQYETYPSGRPVLNWGSGDLLRPGTAGAGTYCAEVAAGGRDYQSDFGPGICPKTFSIIGVMSWHAPGWGLMPGNQNGAFPFNRDSTAFAVDYLAGHLRGCFDGWQRFLAKSGPYRAGDLWGCVGSWYSGDWYSDAARQYIDRVQAELAALTWLDPTWPSVKSACDGRLGCPEPGHL